MLIIVSPSCGGKDFVTGRLIESGQFSKLMSTTTRPIRDGEVNGRDYWFVTRDQFEEMISNGELFEYEQFMDKYYGKQNADVDRVLESGKYPVSIMEPKGAQKVHDLMKSQGREVYTLFLQCDVGTVTKRFVDRFVKDLDKDLDSREETIGYYIGRLTSSFIEEPQWVHLNDWDLIAPTLTEPEQTDAFLAKVTDFLHGKAEADEIRAKKESQDLIDPRFADKYRDMIECELRRAADSYCQGNLSSEELFETVTHGLLSHQKRILEANKKLKKGFHNEI